MTRALCSICLSFVACFVSFPALSEAEGRYPSKPITIVNPGAAGGSVELQVRILADGFRERTGQSLIITNKPGAMGSTGATFVYRAPPDGYTLLASPNSPMVFNPLTRKSLTYEATKLTPIVRLGEQPLVMGVRGDLPGATLNDLIAYAKANPGKTYYGSQGVGGGNHMAAMLFGKYTGADLKHVPFPGAGPASQGLLKGEVDFFMAPLAVLLPSYRNKELKIFAVGGQERAKDVPEVPTFRELGYPEDFILTVWSVIMGPPGMPSDISEELNLHFNALFRDPRVQERFKLIGVDPGGGSRRELADMLARETKTWTRVAEENNIEKE